MHEDFLQSIQKSVDESDEALHGTMHLLTMHKEAASRKDPVILELGTSTGVSTRSFLNAIHQGEGGRLVSVDIDDCSQVSKSPRWTFVQSDSADVEGILAAAPVLRSGIDILYIDSLHHADHVRKELFGFFPFVKDGGVIFFDDLDSIPYMTGQAKDNIHTEIGNRTILKLVDEIFMANQDKLYFSFSRGGTGLGRLQKRARIGDRLTDGPAPKPRNSKRYWKLKTSIEKRLGRFGVRLP